MRKYAFMFVYKKYLALFALLIVCSSAKASVSRLDDGIHIQLRQPHTPGEYVIRKKKSANETLLLISHAGGSCIDHPVISIKLEKSYMPPIHISLDNCRCALIGLARLKPHMNVKLANNATLRITRCNTSMHLEVNDTSRVYADKPCFVSRCSYGHGASIYIDGKEELSSDEE